MDVKLSCAIPNCSETATQRCYHCQRAICSGHTIQEFLHRPGGQRPYCIECDAERQRLYQGMRTQGFPALILSCVGAVIGAMGGYGIGTLVTTNSFGHTIATDVGFLGGFGLALWGALQRSRRRASPTSH